MTTDHLHEIIELAKTRGFEVETHNGWQRFFSLKDDEIALICNRCGEVIETSLSRPDLFAWVSTLECPAKDKCVLEEDERILTQVGTMQWCLDCYGVAALILRGIKYHVCNIACNDDPDYAFLKEIEDIDRIYFAVNSESSRSDDAYLFAKCTTPQGSKYVLVNLQEISFNGDSLYVHCAFHNLWGAFENELIDLINGQIKHPKRTNDVKNDIALRKTLDYYLNMAKKLRAGIVDIWDDSVKDDSYLHRYIKTHKCPVCGFPYTEEESQCSNCGFNDLQKVFINIEEGQYWKKHVGTQYQNDFFRSHFELNDGTVQKKTSDAEFYSIVIPEGVTCLGARSFSGISKLRRIVCPDTLQEIGEDAFDRTFNLKYITLPPSLKSIGSRAFNYTGINHIELPSSLEAIGEEAFRRCSCLEEIVIPSSVTSLGRDVFAGCHNLKYIYCEAKDRPVGWHPDWVQRENTWTDKCPAQILWGNLWHYDAYGKPCIDSPDNCIR